LIIEKLQLKKNFPPKFKDVHMFSLYCSKWRRARII